MNDRLSGLRQRFEPHARVVHKGPCAATRPMPSLAVAAPGKPQGRARALNAARAEPAGEYLTRRRIGITKDLLRRGRPVTHVAMAVGDRSTGAFSPAFTQEVGKTPAAPNGTLARTRLRSRLTFIGAELPKGFSPLFNPATPQDDQVDAKDRLMSRLKWVDGGLAGRAP